MLPPSVTDGDSDCQSPTGGAKPVPMLDAEPRALTRLAEKNGDREARSTLKRGVSGTGARKAKPEIAPTLAFWAKKIPTDKGWDFG